MPFPHVFINLTDDERKRINQELKLMVVRGEYRRRRRLQAVYFSDGGLTYEQICKRLGVSYRAVKLWISTYRKLGLDGFVASMKK